MDKVHRAVVWLEGLFATRRRIETNELHRLAREEGVSRDTLYYPEVQRLPISWWKSVEDGVVVSYWSADDGWPERSGGA